SPLAYGVDLDSAEDHVLDQQADENYGEQAGKHVGNFEQVLVLVDEPAQSARARTDAEYEFGGDQRAPGECPADLQPGENAGKRRRDQDAPDVPESAQAVVAAHHAQRHGYRQETGMGVQGHGPQHRVDQHEHHAAFTKAEPDQRQRQ